uniref:PSP domain-containing protein n=1 Tax=Angiostrongylus cantonensis TaxID=6313 RepID=A0A0K0CU00_ANGCA
MASVDEGVSSDEESGKQKPLTKKQQQVRTAKRSGRERFKKSGAFMRSSYFCVRFDPNSLQTDDLEVEIDYVGEAPKLDENDPNYQYFSAIFSAFKVCIAFLSIFVLDRCLLIDKLNDPNEEKLSRRKLRLAMQPSIAKLKESTRRPDVVEWADVTSRDPFMLVALKSYRNTVPVPRHWNAKRKYLSGKRGFERPPFELPDFIKRTGIQDMREALWEKEENQNLKSKMRERARPKLGKIDIDYQKLHDAFFKWQTKPFMTMMGELYYEGKEVETLMKDKKPGNLSDELRIALGMPVGPNAHKFPPPWLIAMQRYGPPPSYPNIRIAGLNAPIPEGCAFGYHAGGWGKPPVDDYGKPLYGDVFGQVEPEDETRIERRYWGEIGSDDDSDEESEAEEEEDADIDGIATPMTEGLATPSGITTGVTGLETPDTIELRKGRRVEESLAGADTPAAAYHIIPEKRVDRVGGQMMGSTHVYDLSKKIGVSDGGVEVSLDPDAIDLDQGKLQEKYDEQLRKQVSVTYSYSFIKENNVVKGFFTNTSCMKELLLCIAASLLKYYLHSYFRLEYFFHNTFYLLVLKSFI